MNLKRLTLMDILGGRFCKHCKFSNEICLEIDHIWGNGKEMPLSDPKIMDFYLENIENAIHELQVLCKNCHAIKTEEWGDKRRRRSKPITVKENDIPKNILLELEKKRGEGGECVVKNNIENMDWYK